MKKTIWILVDNRIGSKHQAEGVANYLDENFFEITYKEIAYTKLASLPNLLKGKSLLGISKESSKTLKAPWPDAVLSSSRRTAPVARWIKKQNPQTKLFQLLHIGRWGIKDFTIIFAPEHDKHKYSAQNITYTVGSPHFVTKEKLKTAKDKWLPVFKDLPHPITALIIGGSIKKRPFTVECAQKLAQSVNNLKQKEGGSLLITTSRRTGTEAEKEIMSKIENIPHYAYLWGDKRENPYLGYLACADNIIVTGDSVSMCCEATATEKPLYIFTEKNWLTSKHLRFVESLFARHYAVDLSSGNKEFLANTHLNVAKNIAETISKILSI